MHKVLWDPEEEGDPSLGKGLGVRKGFTEELAFKTIVSKDH